MRKGISFWEFSPCRLLPLLLVIILSIIGVHSVHGSSRNKHEFNITKDSPILLNSEGVSNKGQYKLYNRCSNKYVQIRPGGRLRRKGRVKKGWRKGRVDARGKDRNNSTQLIFESAPGGKIYIRGEHLRRYICFNRKGKIVLKYFETELCLFTQKEGPDGYYEFQSSYVPAWHLGFGKRGQKLPQWHRGKKRKRNCFHFLVNGTVRSSSRNNFSPLDFADILKLKQKVISRKKR